MRWARRVLFSTQRCFPRAVSAPRALHAASSSCARAASGTTMTGQRRSARASRAASWCLHCARDESRVLQLRCIPLQSSLVAPAHRRQRCTLAWCCRPCKAGQGQQSCADSSTSARAPGPAQRRRGRPRRRRRRGRCSSSAGARCRDPLRSGPSPAPQATRGYTCAARVRDHADSLPCASPGTACGRSSLRRST